MRSYSQVYPQFWIGETGRKIREGGEETLIVSFYLLTSPHSNMLGLYYCPILYISHETGLTFQGASKGLQRASEAGFCAYDYPSEVVWVYEMAKYQVGERLKEGDNRIIGVNRDYEKLPKCSFLYEFYNRYKESFCLKKARGFEGASKVLPSQEQEQEQEQDKNKRLPASDDAVKEEVYYQTKKKRKLKGQALQDFEEFWTTFSLKKGKAEAADAWIDVYKPGTLEVILHGARCEAKAREKVEEEGRTPIYAQGWLSGRRWEDYEEQRKGSATSFDYSPLESGRKVIIDGTNFGEIEGSCVYVDGRIALPEGKMRQFYREGRLVIDNGQ